MVNPITTVVERDDLLTLAQVSERVNLARSTLYVLITRGELPTVKVGRSRRVRESDLNRFIAALSDG